MEALEEETIEQAVEQALDGEKKMGTGWVELLGSISVPFEGAAGLGPAAFSGEFMRREMGLS
jgi:hypothetical protein